MLSGLNFSIYPRDDDAFGIVVCSEDGFLRIISIKFMAQKLYNLKKEKLQRITSQLC